VSILVVGDLPAAIQSDELVDAMLAGANARALRVAPCLGYVTDVDAGTTAPTDDQLAEAKLVLIGAVKRWAEAGAGALSSQVAGPFQQAIDTRQRTGFNFWPSEIEQLQDICKQEGAGAFSLDTAPCGSIHSPICALAFGATYCSCAADIAGFPLYEDVD
jgi:hypothetical protein